MCGILAVLSYTEPISAKRLQAGLAALQQRGPDGEGIWISPHAQLGLGHRRLAIRDIQGGTQPLSSPDGQTWAVVNGELYDAKRLRTQAQSRGYVFKTQSDSELALALYQQLGLDFVQALRGEFAIMIWDQKRQELIAARDRFGIKPLVYSQGSDGLMLASKARALHAMGLPARWNLAGLRQSLALQYLLPAQSLFADVQQLPPGHLLRANLQGNLKIQRYWDLDYAEQTELNPEGPAPEAFLNLLKDAVNQRLESDVPVCSHLSGGLDSSAVLALMQQTSKQPVQAFTVSFPDDSRYDEAPIALETAQQLGAKLTSVEVRIADLIQHFPDAVRLGEGLSINGHTAAKYLLNRQIRQTGYRVALTGEGADELLLGYAHFRQELDLNPNNPLVTGLHTAQSRHPALAPIQAQLGFVPAWLEAKAALGKRLGSLLTEDLLPTAAAELQQILPQDQLQSRHPVHQAAWLWTKLALGNYILPTVGDGAEMAHGIEGRLPFLDHQLFEGLRGFSPLTHFKSATGDTSLEKQLLRRALKHLLPDLICQRPKHPFLSPPLCASAAWQTFLNESFSNLAALPLVNPKALSALLKQLPELTDTQQREWDPVLNILLSAVWLQAGCDLRGA